MGSGGIAPRILNLGTSWERNGVLKKLCGLPMSVRYFNRRSAIPVVSTTTTTTTTTTTAAAAAAATTYYYYYYYYYALFSV
jgi:hypothetical protein